MRANEFITEHRLVWQRNAKTGTVKMKWRCETGTRKGRTVPNVSDCNKQIDISKSARMRTTRARTGRNQSRQTALTKKRNPMSKLAGRLNKVYRSIQPKTTSTSRVYKWKKPKLARKRAKSTYYK
jgi:hypothetical protein